MFQRIFSFPKKASFFLFGPRQCGKSTLIESHLHDKYFVIDLLQSDIYFKYSKHPDLFRKEVLYKVESKKTNTVFVDEIQKIPALLDEIQFLMRKTPCQFIMTGSSARKLKRGAANLLAGRAIQKNLFPLIFREIGDHFDLQSALQLGTLPAVLTQERDEVRSMLKAYAQTYLREEIQQEGIVRNLAGFSRFLDVACAQFTEITNYTAIGSECGLQARSVQSYYDILEDTLVGHRLPGFDRSVRKQLSVSPKFYFFDNGVTNAVNQLLNDELSPVVAGKLFEQWLVNEVRAYLSYTESDVRMYYWRTNNEAEIDVILAKRKEPLVAVEIRYKKSVARRDCRSFKGFAEEYPKVKKILVCLTQEAYHEGDVLVESWSAFLGQLWAGKVV